MLALTSYILLPVGCHSLHDPHLRKFYQSRPSVRKHLAQSGRITSDGRVIGTTTELYQGVKVSHDSFENESVLLNPNPTASRVCTASVTAIFLRGMCARGT